MYKELEGLVVEERGNSRAKGARAEWLAIADMLHSLLGT